MLDGASGAAWESEPGSLHLSPRLPSLPLPGGTQHAHPTEGKASKQRDARHSQSQDATCSARWRRGRREGRIPATSRVPVPRQQCAVGRGGVGPTQGKGPGLAGKRGKRRPWYQPSRGQSWGSQVPPEPNLLPLICPSPGDDREDRQVEDEPGFGAGCSTRLAISNRPDDLHSAFVETLGERVSIGNCQRVSRTSPYPRHTHTQCQEQRPWPSLTQPPASHSREEGRDQTRGDILPLATL